MTDSRFTGEYTKKGNEPITDDERKKIQKAFPKKDNKKKEG
jgi:hypothetical protein